MKDKIDEDPLFISSRGSLMGEPGTKVLLTVLAKCLDVSTRIGTFKTFQELASHPFQSAGDD
jgi:hypothetical protein